VSLGVGIISSRKIKQALIVITALQALVSLKLIIQSLQAEYVYRKDLIQDYLLAKAVLNGVDPYLPLPELVSRLGGALPDKVFLHPTPHPPPVALLSLPLGLLTYERAAIVWLLCEVICICASVYLLLRWWGKRPGWRLTMLISMLALAWPPLWMEMIFGQLMVLLLLLLILAWQALRSERAIVGGLWLGCVIALKLIAWPILLFFALRRNWRVVSAAVAAVGLANLLAALLMGFGAVAHYYLKVSGAVAPLYRAHVYNFSAWSVGWKVFSGTGSPVLEGIQSPPLWSAPILAQVVSYALPLALLVVGLWLASCARSFDTSVAILVCVSILVNPIAWIHYLVLATIPGVVAARHLIRLKLPSRETFLAVAIGLLLSVPNNALTRIALLFATERSLAGEEPTVPFAAGLLTLIHLPVVLSLLWFVRRTDRIEQAAAHN
jgi:alpha-1,2-mannosyltransferase